ncbi:MAG: DHH family phosphoesterase [Ruminiclostridium sp.]|nr:DHH family phosphoesterase [Ruminiclostridium sp.]
MKLNELLKFNDIAIQCHNFPDADTVATGYALYRYLEMNGKHPKLFYSGPQKMSKSNMLMMTERLEIPIEYVKETEHVPELLVTADCVFGESNVQRFEARNVAAIDHHLCRGTPPSMNEIRSNYGSCSSLIAKMLADEGVDINADSKIATALYYGLYMDTNGLSELAHPADKDLMDFAEYDKSLMMRLRNSNLSCEEMGIAGEALDRCIYDRGDRTALTQTSPCDPNLLGFISDLLLQVDIVESCVVFCRNASGYKLSVRSCTDMINASEFAKYITDGIGNGGGHACKAGGFMSSSDYDIPRLIQQRMSDYHKNTDIYRAGTDEADISEMERYVKQSVTVGFVPSTDIVPAGTEIFIRMLEADAVIKADPATYIMVGISGEAYPIKKSVFEQKYSLSDEMPETSYYEYPPSVIDRDRNTSTPLTPHLRGCVASGGAEIMAKELTRHTKVFTEWDKTNYLYGKPGDYLAATASNPKDMYIIKRDIFFRTYKKAADH